MSSHTLIPTIDIPGVSEGFNQTFAKHHILPVTAVLNDETLAGFFAEISAFGFSGSDFERNAVVLARDADDAIAAGGALHTGSHGAYDNYVFGLIDQIREDATDAIADPTDTRTSSEIYEEAAKRVRGVQAFLMDSLMPVVETDANGNQIARSRFVLHTTDPSRPGITVAGIKAEYNQFPLSVIESTTAYQQGFADIFEGFDKANSTRFNPGKRLGGKLITGKERALLWAKNLAVIPGISNLTDLNLNQHLSGSFDKFDVVDAGVLVIDGIAYGKKAWDSGATLDDILSDLDEHLTLQNAAQVGTALVVGGLAIGAASMLLGPLGPAAVIAASAVFTWDDLKDATENLAEAFPDWDFAADVSNFMGDVEGSFSPVINSVLETISGVIPDVIIGSGSQNLVGGNDTEILFGDENATIQGGAANDWLFQFGSGASYGGAGNDIIVAIGSQPDGAGNGPYLSGDAGDDFIAVLGGEDVVVSGGAGDDYLLGWGKDTTLFGGDGADTFHVGASTFVADATFEDDAAFVLPLWGGAKQWWQDDNTAYWAPFSTITTAFPLAGAGVLQLASFFIDVVTMTFVSYEIDGNGSLVADLGWAGRGPNATFANYEIDLQSGLATAGIAVFEQKIVIGRDATLENLRDFVNLALYAGFGNGLAGRDPLILDLDGDGIELESINTSDVYFDADLDGFAERVSWTTGDDGFLARDINADGVINDQSELFGNPTTAGFAQLATLDSNSDSIIDINDTDFGTLGVWQDANSDGVTDAGEFISLTVAGIDSISLSTTTPTVTSISNNEVVAEATFTFSGGGTGTIAELLLATDEADSIYLGDNTISTSADALPGLSGYGEMPNLRVAMTNDATLESLVSTFTSSTSTAFATLQTEAENILYRWAGVDAVAATAMGPDFDERKLAFLEKYTGRELTPRTGGVPDQANVDELEDMWAETLSKLTIRLAVQGPLETTFANISFLPEHDLLVMDGPNSLADAYEVILNGLSSDPATARTEWQAWQPLLSALHTDLVRPENIPVKDDFVFDQLITAMKTATSTVDLQDLATDLGLSNSFFGTASNDTLDRGTATGTQLFYGGAGDDTFNGGAGQDVYVFDGDFGHVTITDPEALLSGDRIRFTDHLSSEVSMERVGQDLVITVNGSTTQSVTIVGQFPELNQLASSNDHNNFGIEEIQFADGEIMSALGGHIARAVGTGTAAGETITGTDMTDYLEGLGGNDLLMGGDSGDFYVFNEGDGQDVIHDVMELVRIKSTDTLLFGTNITPEEVVLNRDGASKDLVITFTDTADQITIKDQFWYGPLGHGTDFHVSSYATLDEYQSVLAFGEALGLSGLAPNNRIEGFIFEERGGAWNSYDVQQTLISQSTTAGNDSVYGFGTADVFYSSAGDDVLVGLDGGDTYAFGRGSGNDVVHDQAEFITIAGDDTITFEGELTQSDLSFRRLLGTNDLEITINDTGETLTVVNQFHARNTGPLGVVWFDRIERFEFSDGSALTWEDILGEVTQATSGDDTLVGAFYDDLLDGLQGNDILSGGDGSDTYFFGLGYGNDTIIEGQETIDTIGGFFTPDTTDRVVFGAGIVESDLQYSRGGPQDEDLTISIAGTTDTLIITGQFDTFHTGIFGEQNFNRIEEFELADGTILSHLDVQATMLAQAGTTGNETITGFWTNDTLAGGQGADTLQGMEGSDTYVFNSGDGADTIIDDSANIFYDDEDKVVFGAGILPGDVTVTRSNDSAVLTIGTSGDVLTLQDHFKPIINLDWRRYEIETVEFDDGTVWDWIDIQHAVLGGLSTPGDDTIIGFYSGDTLDGGTGNDRLEGGDYGDEYIFDSGYGNDVIYDEQIAVFADGDDVVEFGVGIIYGDTSYTRVGDDLIFNFSGLTDTLTIEDMFKFYLYRVEQFRFTTGEVISFDYIYKDVTTFTGTAANETLSGFDDAEIFEGKGGNDTLVGGNGSDAYIYSLGDGDDIIDDDGYLSSVNSDSLILGPGIAPSDLQFSVTSGASLDVTLNFAGSSGSIVLVEQNSAGSHGIEEIVFDDGTVWDLGQLANEIVADQTSSGNDTVFASNRTESIDAGEGDDIVYAAEGDDEIIGGKGDDRLEGDVGSDTYTYNLGDGDDVIYDWGYDTAYDTDRIVFGAGIDVDDLSVETDATDWRDLKLVIGGSQPGSLLLEEHNDRTTRGIEELVFDDGTVITAAQLAQRAVDAQSTPGDDTIQGSDETETLEGGVGNDTLIGRTGADTLIGGIGDDVVEGGVGNDLYVYNPGDGDDIFREAGYATWLNTDTLRFGAGISPDQILLRSVAGDTNDLRIEFEGLAGSILLDEHNRENSYGFELFEYADGTVWTRADLNQLYLDQQSTDQSDTIYGSSIVDVINALGGDDIVYGGNENDDITGGLGNDVLRGEAGSDTYRFNVGDGQDEIDDPGTFGAYDILVFGAGILPGDVTVSRVGAAQDHVLFQIAGGDDQVLLTDQLSGDDGVEQVEFADGTIWSSAYIASAVVGTTPFYDFYGTSGVDTLSSTSLLDERYFGLEGDDIIISSGGNDEFYYRSGDGNDSIDERDSSTSSVDRLVLTDLNSAAIEMRRGGSSWDDLFIKDLTTGHEIEFEDQFVSTTYHYGVDEVKFSDATIWDRAQILANAWIRGTASVDTLSINDNTDDVFFADAGDDFIYSRDGSDTFVYRSGDGNDFVDDSGWSAASDIDLLRLTDLNEADVELRRGGGLNDDLFIKDLTTGMEIEFEDQFESTSYNYGIESIEFASGTTWSRTDIFSNAWIRGTSGADTLSVTDSTDDTFFGDAGDDFIYSNGGSDTFVYRSGDGNDFVDDGSWTATEVDRLRLLDLNAADVELRRGGSFNDNLFIKDLATGMEIEFEDQFDSPAYTYGVDEIEFADGTVWNRTQIDTNAWLRGTTGVDVLYVNDAWDTVFFGDLGDDDIESRGNGADRFVYRSGDGNDEIDEENNSATAVDVLDLIDLNPSDVELSQSGNDLLVKDLTTDQVINVDEHFYAVGAYWGIEELRFADGTTWDRAAILGSAWVRGTSSADSLYVSDAFDTTFFGGLGDDNIESRGNGADRFVYRSGDGADRIDEENNSSTAVDVLELTDLNPADVLLTQSGNDLLIEDLTTNQVIEVDEHFWSPTDYWGIEELHFADGTVWDRAQLSAAVLPIVLDLDGDGIELTSLAEGQIRFDHNGDGRRDRTSWISGDDGLLVLDRDGDGRINNLNEISFLRDKPGAKSDLEGLAGFDSNGDGLFSAEDEDFASFQIWQDVNEDGQSQSSELYSLDELGIVDIDLERTVLDEPNLPGRESRLIGQSTFSWANGDVGLAGDAVFEYEGAQRRGRGWRFRNQLKTVEASAEDRQLQRLTQAMAVFDGESSASFEASQSSQEIGRRELYYAERSFSFIKQSVGS